MATKKKPGQLRLARARIVNVRGIPDRTFDFNTITEIEGPNGSGKSSVLAALRSVLALDRQSLMRIVRLVEGKPVEGRPEVEVLLVGDDCEARITRKGDGSPEVKYRQGETWITPPRPGDWLRDLIDPGANPDRWLGLSMDDMVTEVLEATPCTGYSRDAALAAAGLPDFRLPAIPAGLHPLEDLEHVESAIFSSRTQVGSEKETADATATSLLAGIPADAPADPAAELAEREKKAEALAAELARKEATIDEAERGALHAAQLQETAAVEKVSADFKATAAGQRAGFDAKVAELRAGLEKRIAELKAETDVAVDAEKTKGEDAIAALRTARENEDASARAAASLAREELVTAQAELAEGREYLAGLRERHTRLEGDRALRAKAEEARKNATAHGERYAKLSAALQALKGYRLRLVEQLPVEGLAVRFTVGEKGKVTKTLTLDGIPFDQVNKARRTEVAVQVAMLRAAPPTDGRPFLSIVLLDDAEKLDERAREALYLEIAAQGAQLVAAVVSPKAFGAVLHGQEALA